MKQKTASPFTAIERINRSEHVRRQLQDAIRHGDYRPGDRLPSERELGELFGVSRVSVREAVSALEAVGLVEVHQGRGSFVAIHNGEGYAESLRGWLEAHRDEVMQLLDVRGALDELAAEAAARHAGPKEIKTIQAAYKSFAVAAGNPGEDVDTLEQLDIRFLESLAAAASNSLLSDLLDALNHHLSTSRKAALAMESRRPMAAREHMRISEAIEAQRPDLARARARKHVAAARRMLLQQME
jgi:GntR family transcriptional repressor for pyruvate dehydrogenase complex